jgi:hypothetical protein
MVPEGFFSFVAYLRCLFFFYAFRFPVAPEVYLHGELNP